MIICSLIQIAVWRHVDKPGPEGLVDTLLAHGQGITIYKYAYKWFYGFGYMRINGFMKKPLLLNVLL